MTLPMPATARGKPESRSRPKQNFDYFERNPNVKRLGVVLDPARKTRAHARAQPWPHEGAALATRG